MWVCGNFISYLRLVNIKNCSHFHSRSQLLVPVHRLYVCMCGWVLPLGDVCSDDQFVCYFTPLTFTLYFFVFYFHTDLQSSSLAFSFSSSSDRSMPSMILETQFSTCLKFLVLFWFPKSSFVSFFKWERVFEKLMHANKCYLLLSYVGMRQWSCRFSCPFSFRFPLETIVKIVFLIKSNCK